MAGDGVLIGRSGELDAIVEMIARGRSITVTGPAGVGKTRVMSAVVDRILDESAAPAKAIHIETVTATLASKSIPLGAMAIQLVDAAPAADDLARVQRRMLQRAAGRTLLIVVDDAHLLDELSATAIHQLVAGREAQVLTSVRDDIEPADAIGALTASAVTDWFVLAALDARAVADMVSAQLGGPTDARLAHEAWVASQGNPMFVSLLLESGLRAKNVVRDHDLWTLKGQFTAETRLLGLIGEQLDQLSPAERRAIDVVALSEPLDAAIGARVIPLATIHALQRRGLIVASDGTGSDHLRLIHPLYGEAARLSMTSGERRAAISSFAEALDSSDLSEAETLLRVALWGSAANYPLDPGLLVRAAAVARSRSPGSAVNLLRAGILAGAPAETALELASVLTMDGQIDAAADVLTNFDSEALGPVERITASMTRAVGLAWTLGRPGAALDVLGEARAAGAGDPTLAGMLDGIESGAHLVDGNVLAAEAIGLRALDAPLPDEPRVLSATSVGVALAYAGRCAASLGVVGAWREASARLQATAPHVCAGLLAARWAALELSGDLASLSRETDAAFEDAVRTSDDFLRARAAQGRARVALLSARPRRAELLMREVLVALGGFDRMFTAWNLSLLAEALAIAGDVAQAREALVQADEKGVAVRLFAADRARSEAAVLAAEGDLPNAAIAAADAAQEAAERGMAALATRCWYDAARYGHLGAARGLESLPRVDGVFPPAYRLHVTALVGDDADALDEAARHFTAVGAQLYAAEAGMDAAAAHQRAGRAAESLASFERSQALLDEADRVMTSALRPSRLRVAGLTPRERQVAILASQNLSDSEIAERLTVSVRTVETHLSRAYAKLAVKGRRNLATLFGDAPLPGD